MIRKIIGIDYSLNSPVTSILDVENSYIYSYGCCDVKKRIGNYKFIVGDFSGEFVVDWFKPNQPKDPIDKYEYVIQRYISSVQPFLQDHGVFNYHPKHEVLINLEGISYSSNGSAAIQMGQSQIVIYQDLIDDVILNIIPPQKLKKDFRGKGSGTKTDMYIEFQKRGGEITDNDGRPVEIYTPSKKIHKPFDDFVDSIALILAYV